MGTHLALPALDPRLPHPPASRQRRRRLARPLVPRRHPPPGPVAPVRGNMPAPARPPGARGSTPPGTAMILTPAATHDAKQQASRSRVRIRPLAKHETRRPANGRRSSRHGNQTLDSRQDSDERTPEPGTSPRPGRTGSARRPGSRNRHGDRGQPGRCPARRCPAARRGISTWTGSSPQTTPRPDGSRPSVKVSAGRRPGTAKSARPGNGTPRARHRHTTRGPMVPDVPRSRPPGPRRIPGRALGIPAVRARPGTRQRRRAAAIRPVRPRTSPGRLRGRTMTTTTSHPRPPRCQPRPSRDSSSSGSTAGTR